jgi:hypothetical protein
MASVGTIEIVALGVDVDVGSLGMRGEVTWESGDHLDLKGLFVVVVPVEGTESVI